MSLQTSETNNIINFPKTPTKPIKLTRQEEASSPSTSIILRNSLKKRKKPLNQQEFGSINHFKQIPTSHKRSTKSSSPIKKQKVTSDDPSSKLIPLEIPEDTTKQESDPNTEANQEVFEFQNKFKNLNENYKVLEKVGEGTFSSVYKAEDLKRSKPINNFTRRKKFPLVALKKIYVTSSPQRIYNELKFLYDLKGCKNIIPLVDAIRFEDQIIIVLPYCEHAEFRDYFRDLPFKGIQIYMRELFQGLEFIHSKGIIHRDIKPNNFLFNPTTRRGILVDFGLAEKIKNNQLNSCPCINGGVSLKEFDEEIKGYLKDDDRPARRANRAGTRGFRAPEVLFKCQNQTPKIDIWSAGIIMLSLLSRRFPFFESEDDIDAIVELSTIFGIHLIKHCAALHGIGFETNLPTLINNSRSFGEIVYYALNMEHEAETLPNDSVAYETLNCLNEDGSIIENKPLSKNHKFAFHFLKRILELNFDKRLSATEALKHPLFNEFG